MSQRPIIDAGPALNFFSINKERLLIGVLGKLSTPETVQAEVLRKSLQDNRFSAAAAIWHKLTPKYLEILSDAHTPALAAVVHRITQLPMAQRMRQAKDLGEVMVVARAVVAAQSGSTVTVLIDDGQGAQVAASEISRLDRLRSQGRPVGAIQLASTVTVLTRAAGSAELPDKAAMRAVYQRLRGLDDGLSPIEKTGLLTPALWGSSLSRRSRTGMR
jgi:hypothetical protein